MKEINDKEKKQGALLHLAQAAIANVLINHITTGFGVYAVVLQLRKNDMQIANLLSISTRQVHPLVCPSKSMQ